MISVCIATYNGERFLRQQLESIVSQLSEGDEVIVSDDGSTDHTLDIVEKIANKNRHLTIRIFHNEGEHGFTANFENALRQARGEYIFLSDQDDVWLPNKVRCCMQHLKKADWVASDAVIINAEGEQIGNSRWAIRRPYRTFLGNVIKIGYIGCCMAMRRTVLSRAFPFPPNRTLCPYDYWLTLLAFTYYKVKVVDEPLIQYRRHGGNVSTGGENAHCSAKFRLSYRLYLLAHVFARCMYSNS